MAIRDPLQFHESPAAVAWWCARGGRLLAWLTPPARRRALLAAAALGVGAVSIWSTLARHKELPMPHGGWPAALVVVMQFALLWLIYRAARGFARLPAPVRRHPQLRHCVTKNTGHNQTACDQ